MPTLFLLVSILVSEPYIAGDVAWVEDADGFDRGLTAYGMFPLSAGADNDGTAFTAPASGLPDPQPQSGAESAPE